MKLLGLLLVIGLTGCSKMAENMEVFTSNFKSNSEESVAQKAVLGRLKDPDSAKFGKFTVAGKKGACLTVNARNSMGGYTGSQQAFLLRKGSTWEVVTVEADLSHEQCVQVMSER